MNLKSILGGLVAAFSIIVATAPVVPAGATTIAHLQTTPLTIAGARGKHAFVVELAITPDQQSRGLMFRTKLARGHGMLFPFTPPRPASFWMKNTLIPLDLLFVRSDGTIAQISPDAVPESLDLIICAEPVAAVLEIGGGEAKRLGIREGDRVRGPGFGA